MKRLFQNHPEALALAVILLAFFAAGEAVQALRFDPLPARMAIGGPARIAIRGDQIRTRLEQRLQQLHLRFEERMERGRRRVHLISGRVSKRVCGRIGAQPALRFE